MTDWTPALGEIPPSESIRFRHNQETQEMADRLDEVIDRLMRHCGFGTNADKRELALHARHELKEVIAESTALELEHYFEWNR